jgi:hypothetical protein
MNAHAAIAFIAIMIAIYAIALVREYLFLLK